MDDRHSFRIGDWVRASHARRTRYNGVFTRRTGDSVGRIIAVADTGYKVVFLLADPELQDHRDPDGLDIWWLGTDDVLAAATPSEEEFLPWLLYQLST